MGVEKEGLTGKRELAGKAQNWGGEVEREGEVTGATRSHHLSSVGSSLPVPPPLPNASRAPISLPLSPTPAVLCENIQWTSPL